MAEYNDLKNRAQSVRDEVKAGANTASRVGSLLVEIITILESKQKEILHYKEADALAQLSVDGSISGKLWSAFLKITQDVVISASNSTKKSSLTVAPEAISPNTDILDLSKVADIELGNNTELRSALGSLAKDIADMAKSLESESVSIKEYSDENLSSAISSINNRISIDIRRLEGVMGLVQFPPFSEMLAYKIGDIVRGADGYLYRFIKAHPVGAWNESHVEEWTLKTDYETMIAAISEHLSKIAPSEPITDVTKIL